MKTRQGVVSNSSSSSFVLTIKKEHHDKVIETIHPFFKACIEALGIFEKKFNSDDIVQIGQLCVMDCSPWEYLSIEYDGEVPEGVDKYEALDKYIQTGRELFGDDAIATMALDG